MSHPSRDLVLLLCVVLAACVGAAIPASAETHIAPTAVVEADPDSLADILVAFERAERAINARDIDTLMSFYSDTYSYHRLSKPMLRDIWEDLFDQYRELQTFHNFSTVRVFGPPSQRTAEITCTGALWATSDLTKLRVPIDSWYEEVHYLVKENGAWRIKGNLGEDERLLPFGAAPHPLF
jgi:hypothetical protein